MAADIHSNLLDYSLHCCSKCKGLFSMPEEKNRHQLTCTANPFKAPCTHFACERKIFLQLFQPEDFEVEGSFHPLNMSKDDSFINHFVKIRMPDAFDPSIFFRTSTTTPPNVADPPVTNFLLEENIKSIETEAAKVPCDDDFLEGSKPIETIDQQQIQNIINKNIEYLKQNDLTTVTANENKASHFPSSQSESRLLSPIDKHLNFLGDVSKSRGQSPFEKCVGYLNDHQFGFQAAPYTYSSTPPAPFSCNLATDLISSFASTGDDNQQPLLTNIEELRTLQYLDLAKKDPFFGQNPGLTQLNSKDPFLITAAVKTDKAGMPGLCNQRMNLAKSCEDIQSQASPSFQLQDANYFTFPSTLDEPTQLDYLDLATLDFLTNPNFTYNSSVFKDKGWKDDDIYSENNLVYHEQSNEQGFDMITFPEKHTRIRQTVEEPARIGKRKMKNLRLKKSKSDLGNPNKTCFIPDSKTYNGSLSHRTLTKSGSEGSGSKKPSRKRKMSETRFDRYRLMPKESFGYAGKRLCKSNKIFNVSDQLTGFTNEEKDSMKAVIGRGDCIFVKKQIGENKKPVVVVEDIPASIVENLFGADDKCSVGQNTAMSNYGKTDHNAVELPGDHSKEKKLTSVLKLKCQECNFSCHSVPELHEHSFAHKTETEVATEAISESCSSLNFESKSGETVDKEMEQSISSLLDTPAERSVDIIKTNAEVSLDNQGVRDNIDINVCLLTNTNDSTSLVNEVKIGSPQKSFETVELECKQVTSTIYTEGCATDESLLDCNSTIAFLNASDSSDVGEIETDMFLKQIALSTCSNQEDKKMTADLDTKKDTSEDLQKLNKIVSSETKTGPLLDGMPSEEPIEIGNSQMSTIVSEPSNISVSKNSKTGEIEITIMDCVKQGTVDYNPKTSICKPFESDCLPMVNINGEVEILNELNDNAECETFYLGQSLSDTLSNNPDTYVTVSDVPCNSKDKATALVDSEVETGTVTDESADVDVVTIAEDETFNKDSQVEIEQKQQNVVPIEGSHFVVYVPSEECKKIAGYAIEDTQKECLDSTDGKALLSDHDYENVIFIETLGKEHDVEKRNESSSGVQLNVNVATEETLIDCNNKNADICPETKSQLIHKDGIISLEELDREQLENNISLDDVDDSETDSEIDVEGDPEFDVMNTKSNAASELFNKMKQVAPEKIMKDQGTETKFGKIICLGVKRHDGKCVTVGMETVLRDNKGVAAKPCLSSTSNNQADLPAKLERGKGRFLTAKKSMESALEKPLPRKTVPISSVESGQCATETDCFKCDKCEYMATKKYQLTNHQVKHSGVVYNCSEPDCTFKSIYQKNVVQHERLKHSSCTKFSCEHCSYSTNQRKTLVRHIQSNHLKEKRYKCTNCDYASMFRTDVVQHYRNTHLQQKLFSCNQCEYKTSYTHRLRLHLMAHAGIRPYKCSACDYQVNDASKVTRHMRTKHAGQTGVVCEKLDLEFEIDAKQFQCEAKISEKDIEVIVLSTYEKEQLKNKHASKGKSNSKSNGEKIIPQC